MERLSLGLTGPPRRLEGVMLPRACSEVCSSSAYALHMPMLYIACSTVACSTLLYIAVPMLYYISLDGGWWHVGNSSTQVRQLLECTLVITA